ncbi:hypothetical protein HYH03_004854 [Edaphochlamys debaryana]|uniref:Uncharacterized protein n=1 Tax=Edaphochlamys debaryana TaxID=47281 RepID=A0A835YEE5_9CHLO|nr:hypothetical protein HYH03_004854 [Edaphochlamys debaryana]|eukprot:KAG2497270.1 hypothetical protein HYH03_004854 [Edaphochlamys debaryana]
MSPVTGRVPGGSGRKQQALSVPGHGSGHHGHGHGVLHHHLASSPPSHLTPMSASPRGASLIAAASTSTSTASTSRQFAYVPLTSDSDRGCPASTSAPSIPRWPAPSRRRVVAGSAVISPPTLRPPSPSTGPSYFEVGCPEGATECSAIWEQLRWCSTWQQMKRLYDNLLRAQEEGEAEQEAAAAATAATAAVAAALSAAAAAASGGGSPGGGASPTGSIDVTAEAVAEAVAEAGGSPGGSPGSSPTASISGTVLPQGRRISGSSSSHARGLLNRDETYAFLLQLQDFYHLRLDQHELDELQAFRGRLVRDLSVYVRRLDAEQLESLCCASAVSGKCLTRERADAVQERLLRILTAPNAQPPTANGTPPNGSSSSSTATAAANGAKESSGAARRRRAAAAGGFMVLTPALNIIFALYDHGYLPQVALLQAVYRQAVDHCWEVTRSQWHGLQGLARRFRFLVDEHWLEDLHAALVDPLAVAPDFCRMSSMLGCIAAFTVNKAMEALDTRVLVVVEAIERRYDQGRSLLTASQLCVFAALLVDMRSPFRTKWLGICLDHLATCRSHLAGMPPATLVLAVELVLRARGWEEQRLLAKLLRQLFTTYAKHPASALKRGVSNVSGCPPRTASRIIAAAPGSAGFGSGSGSVSAAGSSAYLAAFGGPQNMSLAAMAAAAAWDVEVGGAGGAASPTLDLVALVDWLAARVPSGQGPERADALAFIRPLVSELVENNRACLEVIDPGRIPGLIKSVALLGYSPSREWVACAFELVAAGAEALSGAELVAMLRLSHAQSLPLPHATLDAVCSQHARILPLMRAVDLQRLLGSWVADRYIPSREQLEGFLDSVCDAFAIDPATLKANAAAPANHFPSASSYSFSSPTASISVDMDDGDGSLPLTGAADGVAGGMAVRGSGGKKKGTAVVAATGATKAAAAAAATAGRGPGVAAASAAAKAEQKATNAAAAAAATAAANAPPPPPASPPTPPPAVSISPWPAAPSLPSTRLSDAAAAAVAADAVAAIAAGMAKPRSPSLGSLDSRPKGSLLAPEEAQEMLGLLDQYRAILLEAKRSDLLIVMNTYRNAVTATLHEMRRSGPPAKPPPSARLLQAVLRGGGPAPASP